MALALKISVLFSRPDFLVRNVPKRVLKLVSDSLIGSTEHWRGKFSNTLAHLLAVAEEHRRVFQGKQRVGNPGNSWAEAPLDHDHTLSPVDV